MRCRARERGRDRQCWFGTLEAALERPGWTGSTNCCLNRGFDVIEVGPVNGSDGELLGWRLTVRRRPDPGAAG